MIEIPIQACSVNKYYRSCYGRVLISKEGRDFQKELELLLPSYEKVYGKIKLTVLLYFRDNRKRDLDNYNKVLFFFIKSISSFLIDLTLPFFVILISNIYINIINIL